MARALFRIESLSAATTQGLDNAKKYIATVPNTDVGIRVDQLVAHFGSKIVAI